MHTLAASIAEIAILGIGVALLLTWISYRKEVKTLTTVRHRLESSDERTGRIVDHHPSRS